MNGFSMDRRALMQHAMLLLGATTVSSCNFFPGASKPATLGSNEIETLNAFADTLIPVTDTPGAIAAGVPKTLAQMFKDWASQKTRDELSGALQRLDDAARKAMSKGFAELSAADRQTFLSGHDKAALVDVPPPPDAPKGNPFVPLVSVVDNGYAKLKELVAVLYYFSEIGLTKELVYEHVPGGWTASVKVTPKTRPAITFGAF